MQTVHGFPVVTASNYRATLATLGITAWPRHEHSIPLAAYAQRSLTDTQRAEMEHFAPKSEVVMLQDPHGGTFTGFRTVQRNWATVFTLLPGDYLLLTAEFKHGAECVALGLPSGAVEQRDTDAPNAMEACALREFEEETGVVLAGVESLSTRGIPVASRTSTQQIFPFLGRITDPLVRCPTRLDPTEHLRTIAMPLTEWMTMLRTGDITEECAVSVTFLALLRLGRIHARY
jgi:ADP-ribose pyrophosphatase YjhB (NUDIX family)